MKFSLFSNNPNSWYNDLKFYLHHGSCPEYLSHKEKCALHFKSYEYQLINGILFHRNFDGVLLRCLEKEEAKKVLKDHHDGPVGGHFSGDTTA